MPRYFISTTDGVRVNEPIGYELPDKIALANLLRRKLANMLRCEGKEGGRNEFWADALDAAGNRVMTAKVGLSVIEP